MISFPCFRLQHASLYKKNLPGIPSKIARTLPKSQPNIMGQQQNDSAETDAEIGQLSKRIAVFSVLKKGQQNYCRRTEAEIEHLIKVNRVSDIVERYVFGQYFSVTRKRSIMETIMSVVPDNPFAASHPPDGKKDPQETLPENPGAASHPPDGKKDPQGAFTSRKITVMCSDEEVEVDEEVALESQTMKFVINHKCINFALPYVTSKVLSKVIEYCKKHVESRKSEDCATDDDLKAWDAEFIKVDQATLFDLIRGADYLEVKSLSILSCKTFVDMCEGKTQEEVYKLLKVLMHPIKC